MLVHKRAKLYVNPITKQSAEHFLPTMHNQIKLVLPSVPSSLLHIQSLNDHQQQLPHRHTYNLLESISQYPHKLAHTTKNFSIQTI